MHSNSFIEHQKVITIQPGCTQYVNIHLTTKMRTVLFSCLLIQYILCKELLNNVYYNDVEIDTGVVRGFLAEDGDYFAFLGIPYAAPPVGNLRFKAPMPPLSWDTLIANRTVICPQQGRGEEDCLILNVFTPTKILNGPLPVLVYIHGGSFLIGSGQTKGVSPLIKQNTIVVTLNYRLGALGFLCLGIKDAPGNAGLKDQVAALKWVKRNIDKFGGDPNNVTIYGMSAGGASIEMLVSSKMANGLFHRAIVESGTASAVWSLDGEPIETTKNLAQSFLDFHNNTNIVYELLNYFQKKPAKELTEANYKLYENLTDGTFGFVPCLERKLFGIEPFLTNAPSNNLRNGNYNKVPMMFIFTTLEGLFLRSAPYYELNYKDRMNANFKDFMPADLIFDSEDISKAIADNVKLFYFGHKPIGDSTLTEYFNYFGDHLILHGLLNSVLSHSTNGDIVYLLDFAYKGKLGSFEKFYENVDSSGHGDAIKYAILNKETDDNDDTLIVNRMSKIVANFMKYGDPSPTRSNLVPILWPAVKPDRVSYLRLDKELQVLEEPFWEKKVFWDKLYDAYRRPLKSVDPDQY